MDKDVIKEYLKEHLGVEVAVATRRYLDSDGKRIYVTVRLFVDGDEIAGSEDSVEIPK